jgi:hypothetical protein
MRAFPASDYPSAENSPVKIKKEAETLVTVEYENDKVIKEVHKQNLKDLPLLRSEMDPSRVKTVLFLTDSLLSTFSSSKFCEGLTCSKKSLSKLVEIRRYQSEIPFCDYVIISSGINDIYKHKTPLDELIRFSVAFYDECARTCPRTKFIFMSLLQTNTEWVNNLTDDFNTYIFELSLRYPNLLFYDNYQLVNREILKEDGVSINDKAVKFIAKSLVKAVTNLSICYNDPGDPWPLRPSFARKALAFKSEAFD